MAQSWGSGDLGGRLRRIGVLSWSIIGVLVLVGILFRYVLYPIRGAFAPLALALVIVFLLNPIVNRLVVRTRLSRVWATLIVYLAFVGIVVAILVNLVPLIAEQIGAFLDRLPEYLQRSARLVNEFSEDRGWNFRVRASSEEIVSFVETHREAVIDFVGRIRAVGEGILQVLIVFLLAMVLSFYVLVDLPKIREGARNLIPPARRDDALRLAEQVGSALGGFFRGQLLVAVFVGVASAALLSWPVRLPFAIVVGLLCGIFNLVPLIGPFIGAVPAVFLGLLSGNPNKAWQAAVVLLIVQQVDNHIVSPNVMGRTVKLHPITVMLALLAGGTLAGIAGMLVVVPSVAIVKILALYAWEKRGHVIAAGEPEPAPFPSPD